RKTAIGWISAPFESCCNKRKKRCVERKTLEGCYGGGQGELKMNLTTEEQIPQILYKYRDFSGFTRDRVRQIIVENKVWFSSPADLNDPFDCKVHTSFKGTVRAYKKDMLRLLKEYRPNLNRQQRQ